MKTINSLIAEKQSFIRAQRSIDLEDRLKAVYMANPDLKKIDNDLSTVRKSKLMALIEEDEAPMPLLNKREAVLLSERERYMESNKIDKDFDQERPVCSHCSDTGFITTPGGTKVVCTNCMVRELNECFDASGMKDYGMYSLKSYSHAHFNDKKKRKAQFDAIKAIFEKDEKKGNNIYLYIDKVQSGKTYLSVVLVKYAIIEGKSAVYTRAEEISSYDSDEFDFIKHCDFLVIDDYASEATSKWNDANAVNSVLEARSASKLPTVVVSSIPREVLITESDARISGKLLNAVML